MISARPSLTIAPRRRRRRRALSIVEFPPRASAVEPHRIRQLAVVFCVAAWCVVAVLAVAALRHFGA